MASNKKAIVSIRNETAKAAMKEMRNETIKTPEEAAADTKKQLATFGIKSKETFIVRNPVTGKEAKVELSRAGTQESDLIVALADPNVTREQKDFALSMYLWGRGAESSSMMVDLIQYKGTHSKETRVFKSQIRFDFEALITSLVDHFEIQAKNTFANLGYDPEGFIEEFKKFLEASNDSKDKTVFDYLKTMYEYDGRLLRLEAVMLSQAVFQLDEATKLSKARANIALAREREKGGGIYVDRAGRAYDATMPEVNDIIKRDQEATRDIEHE